MLTLIHNLIDDYEPLSLIGFNVTPIQLRNS